MRVSNTTQKRVDDLLYLSSLISNAIKEEVTNTLKGRPSDIKESITYILGETRIEKTGDE